MFTKTTALGFAVLAGALTSCAVQEPADPDYGAASSGEPRDQTFPDPACP